MMLPSHWTQNDLVINGVSLHYLRTGAGSKPPLVLVHGFSDNRLCWLQTALDLEEHFDIIMPDVRGHGLSDRIQPGASIDFAADLAGIIAALELSHPLVGGHSMGAMIAFELAVHYPEIPKALLLEDPPWFESGPATPNDPSAEHPMAAWVETIERSTLDELIAETRQEHPTWPEWVIQTWCPAKKELDLNFLSVMTDEGRTPWEEGYPQLACPTLIVTGDPDKGGLITPSMTARLQTLNSNCTFFHIPGTGHHIRFENYSTYMERVREFFEI